MPTEDVYVISLTGEQVDDALQQMNERVPEGWAVGTKDGVPVPSTSPFYHNNAKYWAEQAHSQSGVTSFNGRTGTVTPQSGDYTAAMVGALASNAIYVSSFNGRSGIVTPQSGDYKTSQLVNDEGFIGATQLSQFYVTAGQQPGFTVGTRATAEGADVRSTGMQAHAEGSNTIASGDDSHAEGKGTTASAAAAHAEGKGTTASGLQSHAEGRNSLASGYFAHAEGLETIAAGKSQHVFGENNVADLPNSSGHRAVYVEIVGNGVDPDNRSNARTLDWSGNEVLAGKLTVGASPTAAMDVATKQYVDTAISGAISGSY